jgi:fructose-1-phosphate kinase PfkB-like protein
MVHALLLASWIMSASTVIVGLNGALQKRFILTQSASLVPGDVHRADAVQVGVGGKGQDVAIALSCLDFKGNLQLAQFVGSGTEGDQVYNLLKERIGEDAMSLTVRPASQMRTCTTIVASDMSTELVEPSGIITEEEQKELMQKLGAAEGESHAGALCIMGSMPPGCPVGLYADIYARVHGKNTLTLIDSVVGLEPLLKAIAESKTSGSAILKVNASELCRLAQVSKTSTEVGGIDPAELVDGVNGFLNKPYAVEALTGFAITDGKHPAHCITMSKDKKEFSIYKIPVPDLESAETLYPIGAGDTVAAGTLSAWRYLQDGITGEKSVSLGQKVESILQERAQSANDDSSKATSNLSAALAFGLACGSASCLQEENSQFDVDIALKLLEGTSHPAFVSSHSIDV